jgi:hypothetical protein
MGSTPESLLENAKITGYLPTGLAEMSVQDFVNFWAHSLWLRPQVNWLI